MTRNAGLPLAALLLAVGAFVSACSSSDATVPEPQVPGASCDAVRETTTEGAYRARCVYGAAQAADLSAADMERLRAIALLKAVQALQKDGYDLVGWTGPYEGTMGSASRNASAGASSSRGFDYIVRGWKSKALSVNQVGAHAIPRLIPRLTRQAAGMPD